MTQQPESVFNISPNIVIAGQIDCAIRATGDVLATGLSPTGGADPPIKGSYKLVDHVTIGIMPYSELATTLSHFTEVDGLTDADKHPWNTIGAVGLDALFVPYTNSRDANTAFLPHYEEPTSSGVGLNSGIFNKSLDPFNPFNSLEKANLSNTDSDTWYDSGHNISFALNYNPYDPIISGLYPDGTGRPVDMAFEKDNFVRHKTEVSGIRSIALRSPLVLSGWGYDTSGNQVPSGTDAAYNPVNWKTGPLDVRWDEQRKVWAPLPFQIVDVSGECSPSGSITGCTGVQCLAFDSGLMLTAVDDEDYSIKIDAIPTHMFANGENSEFFRSTGVIFSGFQFSHDGCVTTIASSGGGSGVQAKDVSGVCQPAPTITGCTPFDCLAFGTGLVVSYGIENGEANIDALPLMRVGSGEDVDYSTKLLFDGCGVSGVETTGCTTTVTIPGLSVKDGSGVCDLAPQITDYECAYKLNFNSGLYVQQSQNDSYEYDINLIPHISVASGDLYTDAGVAGCPRLQFSNSESRLNRSGISFGGMLRLDSSTLDCNVVVEGMYPRIGEVDSSCKRAFTGCEEGYDFDQFWVRSGLMLSENNDAATYTKKGAGKSFYIDSVPQMHISGATLSPYTGIKTAGNISSSVSNCTLTMSGFMQAYETGVSCKPSPTITECSGYNCMSFGTGLSLRDQGGGNVSLDAIAQKFVNPTGGIAQYTGVTTAGSVTGTVDSCTLTLSGIRTQAYETAVSCKPSPTITSCSGYDCIVYGTGLSLRDEGNGSIRLDSIAQQFVDGSPALYTGIKTAGRVQGIIDGCTLTVSGLEPEIKDVTGGSCGPAPVAPFTSCTGYTCLEFGTGLHLTNQGGGNVRVDALAQALVGGGEYTGVQGAGNVTATVSNCTLTISGQQPQLRETGVSCKPSPTITSCSGYDCMVFGTGIQVSNLGGGEVSVNATPQMFIDTDGSESHFTGIKTVGSVTGTMDGCTLTISGIASSGGGGGSGINIIGNYVCGSGGPGDYLAKTNADTLIFGYGLNVAQSGGNPDYRVETDFELQDYTSWYCDTNNPWTTLSNIRFPRHFGVGVGLDVMWNSDETADGVCTGILQTTLNFDGSGCGGDHVYGVEKVDAGCGIKFTHVGSDTCEGDTLDTKQVKISVDPLACSGTPTGIEVLVDPICVGVDSGYVTGVRYNTVTLKFSECGLFLEAPVEKQEEWAPECAFGPP